MNWWEIYCVWARTYLQVHVTSEAAAFLRNGFGWSRSLVVWSSGAVRATHVSAWSLAARYFNHAKMRAKSWSNEEISKRPTCVYAATYWGCCYKYEWHTFQVRKNTFIAEWFLLLDLLEMIPFFATPNCTIQKEEEKRNQWGSGIGGWGGGG